MTATKPAARVAFYFRGPKAKRWTLIGVFDTAEEAWRASLNHQGSGDIWFPSVPPDEPPSPELTSAEFRKFKALRLAT